MKPTDMWWQFWTIATWRCHESRYGHRFKLLLWQAACNVFRQRRFGDRTAVDVWFWEFLIVLNIEWLIVASGYRNNQYWPTAKPHIRCRPFKVYPQEYWFTVDFPAEILRRWAVGGRLMRPWCSWVDPHVGDFSKSLGGIFGCFEGRVLGWIMGNCTNRCNVRSATVDHPYSEIKDQLLSLTHFRYPWTIFN